MVLTADIGNTNMVLSIYENEQLVCSSRFSTLSTRTEDEHAILLHSMIFMYHIEVSDIEGAIISSVVPPLTNVMRNAILKMFHCRVLVVSPGIKTGLNLRLDNASSVGADLVCTAVAAKKKYSLPCIIFDMGTATTITALSAKGEFMGGSILPGIKVSLASLSSSTAQLPSVDVTDYKGTVIGTSTVECMQSGVMLGNAAMIDGMIERYMEVIGSDVSVIATGGMAQFILPYCKNKNIILDSDLLSDGLLYMYQMNTK